MKPRTSRSRRPAGRSWRSLRDPERTAGHLLLRPRDEDLGQVLLGLHVRALGRKHVWPTGREGLSARIVLDELRAAAHRRDPVIRAYRGHFPAFAAELVGATKTVTVLRDPVERSISVLKHRQRDLSPHRTLEQIYDDPFERGAFVHEHQTKIFSADPGDGVRSLLRPVPIDRHRLETAQERLRRIDVVGLQEDHPALVAAAQTTFGWPPPSRDWRVNVADPVEVSPALRDRIAESTRYDRELYDFAVRLVADRSRAVSR